MTTEVKLAFSTQRPEMQNILLAAKSIETKTLPQISI